MPLIRQSAPEPCDGQELQIYLGIYGTSYGGATVVWVAAIDPRVKCTVSVVGIGNGARWMRSVRRPDEYYDLLERSAEDRTRRALEGASEFVKRSEILLPDRQSAELGMAARRNNPAAVTKVPLEFVDDTLSFNPEWVVDKIAPRPVLIITAAMIGWSRRPRARRCTRAPANQRSSSCSKATVITRSMRARRFAR
jgi:hypothetical protein